MLRYEKPEPGTPIVLDLDGEKLELRFTLRTLKALNVEQGISVLKGGMGEVMTDPEKLAVILWYGVKTKRPEITLDWIEDNFDAAMLLDLGPALAYAVTGRLPDLEKILANYPNAERPPEPTGSQSGPLADTTSGAVN